jgi:hypothetical protein
LTPEVENDASALLRQPNRPGPIARLGRSLSVTKLAINLADGNTSVK